ncbi:1,4-dihydroxy-2-naphthoyl-CoA thioesterase 1 [Asimina triloba]
MFLFLKFNNKNLIRWIHGQPFKFLHGGISALVAEALGSVGAIIASGFKRVAGVQLSINHLNAAELGDDVEAEAVPVKVGKTIQKLWEVTLWKIDPSAAGKRILVASSRITVLCNLPMPDHAREAVEKLKMHAKL